MWLKSSLTLFLLTSFQVHANFEKQEAIAFSASEKWRTNSVLITKNGQTIYEKYAHDFTPETPHRLWSMTKSISSLLIGLRIQEGKMKLEDPLTKYFPEIIEIDPWKKSITIENLLNMASGLDWKEYYESNPFQSDVIKILYLKESQNMASYVASRPQAYAPGKHFYYSSGETNLLMGAFQRSFENEEAHSNYPWEKLFTPLGIENATWERDGAGTFVGSSYLFMTPKDMAKIGELMLNEGRKDEKVMIDSHYINSSIQPSAASCLTQNKLLNTNYRYGYQWWLNAECPEAKGRAIQDIPSSAYFALGHHGQTMVVFPDIKVVAVRFGADKKDRFDRKKWVSAVYREAKAYQFPEAQGEKPKEVQNEAL